VRFRRVWGLNQLRGAEQEEVLASSREEKVSEIHVLKTRTEGLQAQSFADPLGVKEKCASVGRRGKKGGITQSQVTVSLLFIPAHRSDEKT